MVNSQDNRLRLCIVVLNYNTPELTSSTIRKLLAQIDPIEHAIIIVDNCSNDESVEHLNRLVSSHKKYQISLIENLKNGGFASGMNVGINAIDAEFYLLLNSDAYPEKCAIKALVHCGVNNPQSVIYPRLQFPDGTQQINYFKDHTYASEVIHAARTGFVTALLTRWDIPSADPKLFNVEWVSFASVLIPKVLLDRFGLLDENFFLYFEDAEYCRRVRQRGVRLVWAQDSHFVHLRGKSSSVKTNIRTMERLPGYYYRSRSYYFQKCYGCYGLYIANLFWYLGRSISLCRELVRNKTQHLPQHAHKDIWQK